MIEKELLKFKELEHVRIEKADQARPCQKGQKHYFLRGMAAQDQTGLSARDPYAKLMIKRQGE